MSAVNVFVLYTLAHYNNIVRSIMPEIDVAEYGTPNMMDELNVAVHKWRWHPSFVNDPMYQDIELRHQLDYKEHKSTGKHLPWTGETHVHSCEVTDRKCRIFLDDKKMLSVRGKYHSFFTPTIGQVLPNHIGVPEYKPIIISNFIYES